MKLQYICLYLCTLLIMSCTNPYASDIKRSLVLAGDNASELQAVLDYYKGKDRKKYKAACFLIANMQYHRSNRKLDIPKGYDSLFAKADSVYRAMFTGMSSEEILKFKAEKSNNIQKELGNEFKKLPQVSETKAPLDVATMKAGYLIDNIERAFKIWHNSPYAKDLSFDDFCEFILPYRTTDEPLTLSKAQLDSIFHQILFADDMSGVRNRIERYKAYVSKFRWLTYYMSTKKSLGLYDIYLEQFKMDCHTITSWTTNIMRSNGIPTVYEYTPQWTDRARRHFWCATPDSLGILRPYTPPKNNLMEDWESDLKYAGKVYRKTFGANKQTPYFLHSQGEYIPDEFSTPLLLDQTKRYHKTGTLKLDFPVATNNKLAYLCAFRRSDGNGLYPVAWGLINSKEQNVVFEQVPDSIVFFPAYYEGDELVPFGNPVMLRNDSIITFNGSNGTQQMTLLRKYPPKRRFQRMWQRLAGAKIMAGNKKNKHFKTLYKFTEGPEDAYLHEIRFPNEKEYRYYRFVSNKRIQSNIAHIEFLGKYSNQHYCSEPTALPVFPNDSSSVDKTDLWRIDNKTAYKENREHKAYDNRMETYVTSSMITLDFGVPVRIEAIRYAPRNANNMIVIGDKYALYYYNKGWKHVGTQVATANYLTFENVPENYIYWLSNLSNGNEELPFFYQDNRQFFINLTPMREE